MKQNTIFWILQQIQHYIPALMVLTAGKALHSLFCVFFALGTRAVIDSAILGSKQLFLQSCYQQAGIIIVILLCLALTRHLQERLMADMERSWKKRFLHGLLHGDYTEVSAYHSAELLNRLNNDVEKVDNGILNILPGAAALLTRLVAAVTVLGTLDARFTWIIILGGILVITSTSLVRQKLKILNKNVSEHDGLVSGYLQEITEKLLIVQAMDVSDEVESRADFLLNQRYLLQRKRKNISLISNSAVSILAFGSSFLALIWCGYQVLLGSMSFGSLTAVIQLVNQLQMPLTNLSGIFPQYVMMIASAERLMELDSIRGEPAICSAAPETLYQQMSSLDAESLSFSFDRDPVLTNTGFSLPKGAFAVITGPSGIGKSTLLKLLLGIFSPESGSLYLNNAQGHVTLDRSTRRLFAYVPQGNLLFSGTIRENLTISAPNATQEALQQAIFASAMDVFLSQLPQGLDTLIGENGAGLSEGQAQRLAIARAVIGGAPILLLDECTSALDEQTEALVLQRLRDLPNRTCIIVTHRPAAIALCDWKLEVSNGQIRAIQVNQKTALHPYRKRGEP